jgi:hypothetical protein
LGAAPMSTKRIPVNRPPVVQITPAALAAFKAMRALEKQCSCPPRDPVRYWEHQQCAACEAWRDQHAILWRELKCRPWEFPCIRPDKDGLPDNQWHRAARQRYRALEAALAERSAR